MPSSSLLRRLLPSIATSIPVFILFVTFVSIPLSAAQQMGLSSAQTTSWIMVLYGFTGMLSILLTAYYRQPLVLTGTLFILIFIASVADDIPYAEIIGAAMVAGLLIALVTLLGITDRLAKWIPAPIVFGLLAGAILSLVADVFTFIGEEPVIVGSTFLTYVGGRRWLDQRIPLILPALAVGLVATALTSNFGEVSASLTLARPTITTPVFSLNAIASVTPIFVVLVLLQSNLPSVIFLRTQDFDPPERVIHLTSGVGTFLGAMLGPMGVSLSLPLSSIVAGAAAGEKGRRYQAVYYVGLASVLIGLLASLAVALPEIIPLALLLTLAGLSLADVLSNALQEITRGPLLIGPLFTFVIAVSDISLFGFGPFFWALLIGTSMSYLLEPNALVALDHDNLNASDPNPDEGD